MAEAGVVIEQLNAVALESENGQKYWMARDIMAILDYGEWKDFREVLGRAERSCENAGNFLMNHFALMPEMVEIGSGARRERKLCLEQVCLLPDCNEWRHN